MRSAKYPTVAFRIDPEQLDRLDTYAKGKGITRSKAIKELLKHGIK